MTKIIVVGHGGYAQGIKGNISMLMGELNDFYFLDLEIGMDISEFKIHLEKIIEEISDSEIVICCDVLGGSPFQTSAIIASENDKIQVVTGVNTAGYCEANFNTNLSKNKLATLLLEVSKEGMISFPEM